MSNGNTKWRYMCEQGQSDHTYIIILIIKIIYKYIQNVAWIIKISYIESLHSVIKIYVGFVLSQGPSLVTILTLRSLLTKSLLVIKFNYCYKSANNTTH